MVRYLLIFWFIPLGSFWGWFGLSFFDLNFGIVYLSKAFHDLYFELCAEMLGVSAESVPVMIAKACIVDTLIVFGIIAFGKWRKLVAWWRSHQPDSGVTAARGAGQAPPAE